MSIRFQADADLNFDIVRPVRQQEPAVDSLPPGMPGCAVSVIPRFWPGLRGRTGFWYLMTAGPCSIISGITYAGKSRPGLLIVSQNVPIGPIVESIIVLWSVSDYAELRNQAYHLPSLIRHVFPR